jgi:hypothetical protein
MAMNNKYFKLKQTTSKKNISIRLKRLVVLLFILAINVTAIAQDNGVSINQISFSNNQLVDKIISYNENIVFGNVESSASWIINCKGDNKVVYLKGNEINDYVFEKPGTYEVQFHDNKQHKIDDCFHTQFNEKMIIEVSAVKMDFDFSKITFSEKILRGQSCDGIMVTVPVNVKLGNNASINFKIPDVTVAGIGVDLKAIPLENNITIRDGVQYIKYQLSGIVNKETYLMFDFVDVNNQVQSYSLPQLIN